MKLCYETSDGEIFYNLEKAKAHEAKIEHNKVLTDCEGNEDVAHYLNTTYSGRDLLKKHSLDEEGIWEVKGEDPNCDLGGYHHCPHLFTAKGKLIDVLNKAVNVPKFYTWGGGGTITKTSIEILDIDTGRNEVIE